MIQGTTNLATARKTHRRSEVAGCCSCLPAGFTVTKVSQHGRCPLARSEVKRARNVLPLASTSFVTSIIHLKARLPQHHCAGISRYRNAFIRVIMASTDSKVLVGVLVPIPMLLKCTAARSRSKRDQEQPDKRAHFPLPRPSAGTSAEHHRACRHDGRADQH